MKNIIKNINLKRILLIILIIFIMLSTTYESYGWYSSILTRPFTNFIVQVTDGINTIVTVAIQKIDYPNQVFEEAYAEGDAENGNDSEFISAISAMFETAQDAYVSPEQIFQGDRVPITNINIFEAEDASDSTFSTMGPEGLIKKIKGTVQQLYLFIRNISAIVMLGALIYVGIMIILTRGNPKVQSEWRQRIVFWAKGLILVMFIHVLMIAILYFSQKLKEVLSISYGENSLLWTIKKQYAGFHLFDGTGLFVEAMLYAFTSYAAWVFAIAYFKRFMYMMVMIIIAPIFGALYGTGNFGKQRFNHWLREFIAGVLVQPFHILIFYILFYMPLKLVDDVGTTISFGNTFVEIYALMAILMIRPIEKFVRALFGLSGTSLDNVASFESGKKTIDNGINAVKKVGEVAVMIGAAVATGGASLGATAGTMAKAATAKGAAGALPGGPTPKPQLPGGPTGGPKSPGNPLGGGGNSPIDLDPAGGGNALQLPERDETLDNPTGFTGDVFSTDDTNSLYGENYGTRRMNGFENESEGDSELGDNIRSLNNNGQKAAPENETGNKELGDDKRIQDGEISHIEDILQDAFSRVKNGEPLDIEDFKNKIEEGGGDPQYIDSIMSNLMSVAGTQNEDGTPITAEAPEVKELNANNIESLDSEGINKTSGAGEKKEEIAGGIDQEINGQTNLNADNVENLDAGNIGASNEGSDSFEKVLKDALAQGVNLDVDEFDSRLSALGIDAENFRKNIENLGLDPDEVMDRLGIETAEIPEVEELETDNIGSLDSDETNKIPVAGEKKEEIAGGIDQNINGPTNLNAENIENLGAGEVNKTSAVGEKKEEIAGGIDQEINGQTNLNADNVENLDAGSIGASNEGSDSFEKVLKDALAQGVNLDVDEFDSRLSALGIDAENFRKNIENLGLDPDEVMDRLGIETAEIPKVEELETDNIGSLDSDETNKIPVAGEKKEQIAGGTEQKIEGQTHSNVDNIESIDAQRIGTIGVQNQSNNAEEVNKAPGVGEKKEEITGGTYQKINGQTNLNADNVENLDAGSIGASNEDSDSFEKVLKDALAQGENLDIDGFNSRLDALGIGKDDFRKNVEDFGLNPDEVMDKLGIEELNNDQDTTKDEDKTKKVEHVDAEYIGTYDSLDDYKTKTSGEHQSTIEDDNKKTGEDITKADNLKANAANVLLKGDKVSNVGGAKMDMGNTAQGTTGTNNNGSKNAMMADMVLKAMGIEIPKKDEKMSRVESTFRILTSPEARKKYSEAAEAMHGFTDSLYVQGGSGDSGIPRKLFTEMTEKRKQNIENRFINNQGNINAVIQAKGYKDKVDKNGVVYKTKEEQAKDFLKSAAPYADSGITDIKTIISIMNKGGAPNTGDINSVLHSIVQNNTIQNKINKENRQTVEAHNSFVTNSNNINQIRENVQKRMGISQGDMSSKFIREQVDKAVSREIEKALPYITNGVVTNASRLIDVNRLGDEISKHVKVTNQAQSVNMVTRADKIIQDALKQGLKEIKLPTNHGVDKATTAQIEKILNAELLTRRTELNSSQASRQASRQVRAKAENTANRSNVGGNTAKGRPNTRTLGEQNQNPQQGMPRETRRGRPRK